MPIYNQSALLSLAHGVSVVAQLGTGGFPPAHRQVCHFLSDQFDLLKTHLDPVTFPTVNQTVSYFPLAG